MTPPRFGRSGPARPGDVPTDPAPSALRPRATDPFESGRRPAGPGDRSPGQDSPSAPAAEAPTPTALSPERERRVDLAIADWRARLLALGGESALADIDRLGGASIDLTAAHPSGVAQLFAGRPTLLSNLIREGSSLSQARRRARTVLARADELAQRYGVAPTYLAIGIATWTVPADGAFGVPLAASAPEPGEATETPVALAADADVPPSADSPAAVPDLDRLVAQVADGQLADGEDDEIADVESPRTDAPAEAAPPEAEEPDATAATQDIPSAAAVEDVAAAVARRGAVPTGSATPRTMRIPVLLRPVRLTARSETDVDVVLDHAVEVNPVLVRALRSAGSPVDPVALTRATTTEYGFTPRRVLERLREAGEDALPDFRLADHLVLGPFVHPGQVLVEDLESRRTGLIAHDVVAAVAGDPDALGAVRCALPEFVREDRAPDAERGVGDLDPTQQHAVDAVAGGAHLFVDAPPGADATATVAAILADAAASGRHTLYVPGTRRAGQALTEVMAAEGLGDLILDLSADSRWRPEVAARLAAGARLTPPEVDQVAVRESRAALVDARARLSAYMTALHAHRDTWGVSAYDALQHLAALTSARPSPRTTVRLTPASVRALHGEVREATRAALVRAAELGAFRLRPGDTPWFGASLTDDDGARVAARRVARLSAAGVPEVRRRIADAAAQTGLERARTLREWGEQLTMLDGVRDALDVFLPVVFERSAADMVVATASRQWRSEHGTPMRWRTRRRLRRQAKDMIRPGRAVSDLHRALVHVQEQREVWRRHCEAGGWPRLPDGLSQIEAEYARVAEDAAALESVLATTPEGAHLADVPLLELEERLTRLAADSTALQTLPERTRILDRLTGLGLRDLLTDLAERSVPTDLVAAEYELAWWTSVFEEILRADPALAGHDGETLGALADRLRDLDVAQVESLPAPVLHAVAERTARLLRATPAAAGILEDLAAGRVADVRSAVGRLGPVAGALRPCWLVAPMQVPQLLAPETVVDLVVLDAAQHLPVEQAVAAVSRARQVVVIGDSRRAALHAPGTPRGIVDALADVLPRVTLSADRVVREPALMAFLGEHGYADVIRSVPTPERRSALRLEVVDGFGMPAPGADVVESVEAEVDRVVDLVIEHALTRPDESLVVLTPSRRHADRVRESVRTAVADSPAVRDVFAADRPEPFAVLELDSAAGVRRDAVILSLGLGKTPHGRVMHRFGRIGEPDGAGLLIDAIDACRRRLTVVSCFHGSELDRWRLRSPGSMLLADLLEAAEGGGTLPAGVAEEGEPDRLLVDLAERLWQLGLTVVPRYGVQGGVRIPLVISHPALPDRLLLAVLTDDADYVAEPCLRIRDRHDVQRLVDRGWVVRMAFSTGVFLDPQAVAEQVHAAVLDAVREHLPGQEVAPLPFRPLPERVEELEEPEDLEELDDELEPGPEPEPEQDAPPDAEAAPAPEAAPEPETPSEPRPDVPSGLPITSYSADDLDALAAWLVAREGPGPDEGEDGQATRRRLDARLREELGVKRRGAQVDAVLGAVLDRVLP